MGTEVIVAIDMGTSRIVGMAGRKNSNGTLTILAGEAEFTDGCIRRGNVYNVEETAMKVNRLLFKLKNKLRNLSIDKVYVGIGGQSMRAIDHSVPKVLGADGVVTKELIDSLFLECKKYSPDLLDTLTITSPTYVLDGKQELNPVGVPCSRIEAKYKLIVGRPSLKRNVYKSVEEKARVEIAGVLVSPLALAEAVLTEAERDLGCALIDFGAGVTTLSVYKQKQLKSLCVIPLGGNLITRDVTSLNLVETEAERLKISYGSATLERDSEQTVQVNAVNGLGMRELKLSELNQVIEARMEEILENVYARLEEVIPLSALSGGIIIAGGASGLKNLREALKKRTQLDVRYSSVQGRLLEHSEAYLTKPEFAATIGLLLQGQENCVSAIVVEPVTPTKDPEVKPDPVDPKTIKPKPPKEPRSNPLDRWKKKIGEMSKGLFDEEV